MLTPAADRKSADAAVPELAERLNHGCFCVTLDHAAFSRHLDAEVGISGFAAALASSHPSLFSNVPVFVSPDKMLAMEHVVAAVEAAAQLSDFQDAAMAWAPAIALADFGPVGALMGYDFHISADGPRLIEVNTNAGGLFLNHALAAAQRGCCLEMQRLAQNILPARNFAEQISAMFIAEWRLQFGTGQLSTIAIVDDDPEAQFLLPEFQLARSILNASGIQTVIADPASLRFDGVALWFNDLRIDLVYNRLVDFALSGDRHAALRSAYESGRVVVTPNPHNHALLADKRNLALLSDDAALEQWGLAARHRRVLQSAVPATAVVGAANADNLWADRRNQFFKPAGGHGSKAAYRGEKLTRKVWAEILSGSYVAQAFAPPSNRMIVRDGAPSTFKVDVRLYTYAGTTLLAAARLYQGQTTNMRTPGGGFAPVLDIAGSTNL